MTWVRADVVLEAAAELFGTSPQELRGPERWSPLTDHRSVTMAAVHELAGFSLSATARLFHREHTTVRKACGRVRGNERLRRCFDELAAAVEGTTPTDDVAELRAEVAELRRQVELLCAPEWLRVGA